MAHIKQVEGRSYPHLYNLDLGVGKGSSIPPFAAPYVPSFPEPAYPGWTPPPEPTPKYTASYQPNRRDDVMLVQYLLKRIYQQGHNAQPPLKSGVGDPHSPATLTIDGVYGPKTQHAIEQFQLEMRRNGQKIATDGSVDPEKGESSTASISQTGYTISWLNKYLWLLYPALAPDIRVDPECPMELKQSLSKGRA